MRQSTRRAAQIALCALAIGCAGPRAQTPADTRALLRIDCPVPDATVWIDDDPGGEVAELARGARVRPGEHRVEVRHDRYHTRYLLLTLRQGEERTVRVSLVEVLD